MVLTDTSIILLINLLHFLNYGLILSVISTHISFIGGNQVVLGFIYGGVFVCQKLSRDFLALFEHNSKVSLSFCLFITFLGHIIGATTDSYIVLLLVRWMTALANSVEACSKELIVQIEPEENHNNYLHLIDILKTAGHVVGAITGGYIYHYTDDFEINSLLAAINTLIAILLLQQMPEIALSQIRQSKITQLPEICYSKLKTLMDFEYRSHWDVILLHTTYMASFIIFFAKYSLLLQYNYEAGIIITGYTMAYQTMLLFACNTLILCLKKYYSHFSLLEIFDHCLLISSVFLFGLYYAPSYDCYLLIFIPTVITYTVVNNCLADDLKKVKSEEKLLEVTEIITIVLNVVAPILFGLLYHTVGGKGFKVLSIVPLTFCVYYINGRFFKPQREEPSGEEIKED